LQRAVNGAELIIAVAGFASEIECFGDRFSQSARAIRRINGNEAVGEAREGIVFPIMRFSPQQELLNPPELYIEDFRESLKRAAHDKITRFSR